jgi:hypothetical protein
MKQFAWATKKQPWALAGAVAVALVSVHAYASWCTVDGVFVEINPPAQSVAPLNTHVRVRMTLSPRGPTPQGRIWVNGRGRPLELDAILVSLRLVGETAVPAEQFMLGLENERIVELVPRQPLLPGRRYQIVVSRGARTAVAHTSVFTTGASNDATPPMWKGVNAGRVVDAPRIFAYTPGRPEVRRITSSADRDHPWIAVEAPEASDDGTPSASLQYGAWIAGGTGVIDYSKPPLTYVSWREGHLLLGRDEAYPEDDLCDLPMVPFPRDAGRFRLGLRAVDWAGNRSTPSEIVLDATRVTPSAPPATSR